MLSPKRQHLANLARHPLDALRFIVGFGARRFLARSRRPPGFFVYNPGNAYRFQYHGEHLPRRESRVTLDRQTDALGMRMLAINLRFTDADIDGVVRAHRHWDAHLRACGVGELCFLEADPEAEVAAGLAFHQVGRPGSAATAEQGVVDADLKVFGVSNVYVVSSSTFVTSGQANSTFMVVAFAVRLADQLADELSMRSLPRPV